MREPPTGEHVGPHELLNPEELVEPSGFSHAVVAAPGRLVFLGGQTAHGHDGELGGRSVVEQFERAAANVVTALRAAGGSPEHLVSMEIFVTDADEYRRSLSELGEAYRRHFGRHFPAVALLEVKGLFDPEANVELVCTAVIPSAKTVP